MKDAEISILKDAGLTQGESRVYLALLETGVSSIGPILEKSGVTKSIIYRILEKLVSKGLVSYVIKEKTKYYEAQRPEKLLDYIDEKEAIIQETKSKIKEFLPNLISMMQHSEKSMATVYEGFKGIMTVHDKRFDKLKKGEEYFFFGLPEKQPEHFHAYWQRDHILRAKLGIKCRMLYNQKVDDVTLKNRNSFKGCDARRMPISVDTPAWILGYKDVTVIGITLAEKPLAFEIVNKEVANSFRGYFEWFWNKSKPFK